MQLIGYGEDALTLWALKEDLPEILEKLQDPSDPAKCKAFFRPSFGRSGGPGSDQFGEFDFILMSEKCLYLGESKWRANVDVLPLDPVQLLRHDIFTAYVEEWFRNDLSWASFTARTSIEQRLNQLGKKFPKPATQLAHNLEFILRTIREHFAGDRPRIRNVLLFFFCPPYIYEPKSISAVNFELITIKPLFNIGGEFISIKI